MDQGEELVFDDEATPADAVKKLREKLTACQEERTSYLTGWQRTQADFANHKRHEATLQGDKELWAKADLIEQLLPALDALELSLKHSPSPELSIVHKQLMEGLKKIGVERYGSTEDTFDHSSFEALQQIPTEKQDEDQTIAEVHRVGFKIGTKIIRPAQITIRNYHG